MQHLIHKAMNGLGSDAPYTIDIAPTGVDVDLTSIYKHHVPANPTYNNTSQDLKSVHNPMHDEPIPDPTYDIGNGETNTFANTGINPESSTPGSGLTIESLTQKVASAAKSTTGKVAFGLVGLLLIGYGVKKTMGSKKSKKSTKKAKGLSGVVAV